MSDEIEVVGVSSGEEIEVNVVGNEAESIEEETGRILAYIEYYDGYPKMDGHRSAGTSELLARGDHVHPTDISRASTADLAAVAAAIRGEIDNTAAQIGNDLDAMRVTLEGVQTEAATHCDELEVDSEGLVYLLHNGERIAGPYGPFAGGGGGGGQGGGNNATLTVANESGWLSKTIADGADCIIYMSWSSVEDEMPTGDGTLRLTVNGVVKASMNIQQGNIQANLKPYLQSGSNVIKANITDIYGNSRTIAFNVTSVSLSLSSSFDNSVAYQGIISFPYTPVGAIDKTMIFILDGTQIGTYTTSISGRQLSYAIPAQNHGAHRLECYFTSEVNGEQVESNHLYYDIICDAGESAPIITSDFARSSVQQYETINIPFYVYNPESLTADIAIKVNGTTVSAQTVDRTQQSFVYRPDNSGAVTIAIQSGTVIKTISLAVTESEIDVEAETEDLALYLSSKGRSNNEANKATWNYGNIEASLTGFNWTSDGWQQDDDGITVLRVAGEARVSIPYKIFQTDFRGTGKTIEIEFATRDVMDYDAVIMSCMNGGRGMQLTAQRALLASEQSSISTQYKEDEHVRISFVAEKRSENRLLLIYINGIASGVVQYPADDDFSQMNPVNISIGSSDCAVDLYCIRVYDNDLTRHQILDNWIADTQVGSVMLERFSHNNVFDAYGKVVISKLPADLPYMIIECPEMPQYKGDKKTVSGSYVDPINTAKSFTFTGCQINVQGTSSAPYARKNYDLQFKNGFEIGGSHAGNYALTPNIVPFNRFVLKADVASSESANNVELVKLFCDATPFKRREQDDDPRVRQGIYGFPIVLFWHDTANDVTTLMGKYNFNLPKRAPGPYGYSGNMESWEFQNNTSNLMLFKSDYFDETMYTDPSTGDTKEVWRFDYEARFPSDEWTDYGKLQELQSFIYSTYRANATGNNLPASVTYDGTTYTKDTAAYRLAKFKAEFGNYAEVNSFLFYYIFTELFLMVDSRAKNLFIGFSGSDTDPTKVQTIDRKAVAEPYDMDTAIGTNNEGSLVFGYSYEDTDHLTGGADVFNGQDSVLWCNLRDAFQPEIVAMYQTLRVNGVLSFASVEQRFEEHQAKWPEAIFNEDAWFKYIDPLTNPDPGKEPTGSYLPMMQGSKAEQRKWWLYNRFKYMDSKWNAGDALLEWIQVRGYAKANVTVTPYADIYPTVKYGSYLVSTRGQRGQASMLVCPIDTLNDTEIYIYSASQLKSVGDLSGLKVGFADFSKAIRLQEIKLGDSSNTYDNGNLKELHLGSNKLLKKIDCRNCSGLGTGDMKSVDISGCANIEELYFAGTAIQGVSLPNGGVLKTLQLPDTITNLTIRNQRLIQAFSVENNDYSNITTLRIENSSAAIPVLDILSDMAANSRVRIIGFTMTVQSTSDVEDFYDYLDTMRGLDESGNNLEHAVASGTITGLGSITGAWLAEMQARYPDVSIQYEHITAQLKYYNNDGTQLINTETITDGGNGSYSGTPSRAATAANTFTFVGWSRNTNQNTADPTATQNVTADRSVYAAYTATGRTYTVYFYNGSTLLQTVNDVPYGGTATYTGATPMDPNGYDFTGWLPAATNIQGNTSCYAQFAAPEPEHTITDTWAQIIEHIQLGDYATRYSIGDTMSLNLGEEGYINMQIAAFDTDPLASDPTKTAPITWISEQLLKTSHRMNPSLVTNYKFSSGASFTRGSTSSTNTSYNQWKAQNRYLANNAAKITITVTAVADGTLRIKYLTGSSSGNSASLKVNGTNVAIAYSTSVQNYDLAITNGTTYTIEFECTKLNNTDSAQDYIKLANTSDSGKKADVDALVSQADPVITNCQVREIDDYQSGTGTIGGYAESEMRTYMQNTIKPLIPAEVRSAIKSVKKYTTNINTAGSTVNNVESTEDVWIPSAREVGITGYENSGQSYTSLFTDSNSHIKKKTGGTSGTSWWLRSANNTAGFGYVHSSGNGYSSDANNSYGVTLGFCT